MDRELRALARAANMDGSLAARALHARMRADPLGWRKLDLAARLGHAPALTIMGELQPFRWLSGWQRVAIERELGRLMGQRAIVLWGVDCAQAVLHFWRAQSPADPRPFVALQAARRWADCPCLPCLEEVRSACIDLAEAMEEIWTTEDARMFAVENGSKDPGDMALWAALTAASSALVAAGVAVVKDRVGTAEGDAAGFAAVVEPRKVGARCEWQVQRLLEYLLGEPRPLDFFAFKL